jgi:adenylate cyclase
MSGTRTEWAILFADVCESTSIYETIGDAPALALINRLFKLLEREVVANHGTTVKTLGDGLVCRVAEADGAFRAACGMQEAVALLRAGSPAGLKIKVAFTHGPVLLEDEDVFGDTVNVCARLASLANPAQVLTTQQTVEALSPGLRTRCRELYATKVRGRAGQVSVWEVIWRIDEDITKVDLTQPSGEAPQWVVKLSYAGESFVVEADSVLRIGRDASNDLVVPSPHASRLHARIFARDDHFVIVDQSANGTYLMVDGAEREARLRRSEALLGERGWIGLGASAAHHGEHVLRYRIERVR